MIIVGDYYVGGVGTVDSLFCICFGPTFLTVNTSLISLRFYPNKQIHFVLDASFGGRLSTLVDYWLFPKAAPPSSAQAPKAGIHTVLVHRFHNLRKSSIDSTYETAEFRKWDLKLFILAEGILAVASLVRSCTSPAMRYQVMNRAIRNPC